MAGSARGYLSFAQRGSGTGGMTSSLAHGSIGPSSARRSLQFPLSFDIGAARSQEFAARRGPPPQTFVVPHAPAVHSPLKLPEPFNQRFRVDPTHYHKSSMTPLGETWRMRPPLPEPTEVEVLAALWRMHGSPLRARVL